MGVSECLAVVSPGYSVSPCSPLTSNRSIRSSDSERRTPAPPTPPELHRSKSFATWTRDESLIKQHSEICLLSTCWSIELEVFISKWIRSDLNLLSFPLSKLNLVSSRVKFRSKLRTSSANYLHSRSTCLFARIHVLEPHLRLVGSFRPPNGGFRKTKRSLARSWKEPIPIPEFVNRFDPRTGLNIIVANHRV